MKKAMVLVLLAVHQLAIDRHFEMTCDPWVFVAHDRNLRPVLRFQRLFGCPKARPVASSSAPLNRHHEASRRRKVLLLLRPEEQAVDLSHDRSGDAVGSTTTRRTTAATWTRWDAARRSFGASKERAAAKALA